MGDTSLAVFGRDKLPDTAIIRAGAYFDDRTKRTLDQFDMHEKLLGKWMPYCYATKNSVEVIIIFNVYGAASTLEVLRILQDGGVIRLGFIGSAFSKRGMIGEQLLVTKVFDQAGVVRMDGAEVVERRQSFVNEQRQFYVDHDEEFTEVAVASVPCVMHSIPSISEFIGHDKVDAVEMELSTYFHFAEKGGMASFAFIYVSDNPKYSLLENKTEKLREKGMIRASELLVELLISNASK